MLKLMCHCEDSKQMGKGQGFFVAKCVSMATAICVHHQKALLFGCGGSLEEGGAPLRWLWVVYFCFTFHLVLRTVVIG